MRSTLIILFIFVFNFANAQFQDNFSDGDFTANPTWIGDVDSFEVNASKQLHLNAPANAQKSYLAVSSQAAVDGYWEFYVDLDFNPSSTNRAIVYIMSDQSNLKGGLNGYFVMIGNTEDEVSLYRQDGVSTTKIIDGVNATVALNPKVVVKVTRDLLGNFELFTDTSVAFNNPISEGTFFDNTYMTSSFFGVRCEYTATRSDKFIFDNFDVTAQQFVDVFPPKLNSFQVESVNAIKLKFSEELTLASAQNNANYSVNNSIGNPLSSTWDYLDNSVSLVFANNFASNTNYTLSINNMADLNTNLLDTSIVFSLSGAYAYQDIIFNELLADESPSFGLPEYEFIEFKNLTPDTLFTAGWSITDLTGVSYFPADYILPFEYVIVCNTTAKPLYAPYGKTFGLTSFISLNKTEELLTLYDKYGNVMDSLRYFDKWFAGQLAPNATLKVDGGFTLARMQDDFPCASSGNWTPSNDAIGGSPGAANNFDPVTSSSTAPKFISANFVNDTTIQLNFDQEVIGADDITNYDVTAGYEDMVFPQLVTNVSGSEKTYFITIKDAKDIDFTYSILLSNIQNCYGLPMVENSTTIFSLKTPEVGDLIINEVLFTPFSGGKDYIEIYNNSTQAIDLKGLSFVEYHESFKDSITEFSKPFTSSFIIPPGAYFTFTESIDAVTLNYIVDNPEWLFKLKIPNLADKEGDLALVFFDTLTIDRLHYYSKWSFELLDSKKGVSLERIKANSPTQDRSNWASAAAGFGYGTPTAKNSQAFVEVVQDNAITISPEVFTPNQDGNDDYALINYVFEQPGFVATVAIYDVVGRKIKDLATKETIGAEGFWKWDGTNYNREKAKTGMYVVLVSVFDLSGKKKSYKKTVVLGTKF